MNNSRTHAQNRFLRRLSNQGRNSKPSLQTGKKGDPILGNLTPTEAAKKLRRKARRLVIATESIKALEHSIAKVKSNYTEDDVMRDLLLTSLASHLQAANKTLARLS